MTLQNQRYLMPLLFSFAALSSAALAVEYLPDKAGVVSAIGQANFSSYAGREFPTRVLWGDTHLHTVVSVDAGTMCRLGQEGAFRFARGEEVRTPTVCGPSCPGRWILSWFRITPRCTA